MASNNATSHTPDPSTGDPTLDAAGALRKLRMAQISAMVAIALALSLPFFVYTARWAAAIPLFAGLVVSIICFLLNHWVGAALFAGILASSLV